MHNIIVHPLGGFYTFSVHRLHADVSHETGAPIAMKMTPLPDGRIAIVYTAEEDSVLDRLATPTKPSRAIATDIFNQLTRASNPALVEAIARLGSSR